MPCSPTTRAECLDEIEGQKRTARLKGRGAGTPNPLIYFAFRRPAPYSAGASLRANPQKGATVRGVRGYRAVVYLTDFERAIDTIAAESFGRLVINLKY